MSNPNTERDIKTISFGRACRERLGMYLSSDQTEALHLGLRDRNKCRPWYNPH